MTNEALVTLIQQGRSDLVPVLWFQVERFIAQRAKHWTLANRSRVEFDDLYQAGFLAVMEAVRTFDRKRGVKFVTWLGYPLHKAFQDVLGIRTERQRRDPLRNAVSLDAPVQEDEISLRDMVQDPRDDISDAEHRIFLEQLRTALQQALHTLPKEQREILLLRFRDGMTRVQIAEAVGEKLSTVLAQESKGLQHLGRGKNAVQLRKFVDDRTPFYQARGIHSIEQLVLRREKLGG